MPSHRSSELQQINAEMADLEKQGKQYQKVIDPSRRHRSLAVDRRQLARRARPLQPASGGRSRSTPKSSPLPTTLSSRRSPPFRPPGNDAKGGIFDIQAAAKDAAAVAGFEERLRDDSPPRHHRRRQTRSHRSRLRLVVRPAHGRDAPTSDEGGRRNEPARKNLGGRRRRHRAPVGRQPRLEPLQRFAGLAAAPTSIAAQEQTRRCETRSLERGRKAVKQPGKAARTLAPGQSRRRPIALPRLARKTAQGSRPCGRRHPNRPAHRPAPTPIPPSATPSPPTARSSSHVAPLHVTIAARCCSKSRGLQMRPTGADAAQLSITLQTEALILPGTHARRLPDGDVQPPGQGKRRRIRESHRRRNLFTAYTPPRPPGAAPIPPTTTAAQTTVR